MDHGNINDEVILGNIKIVLITDDDFQFGYDIRKLTMEDHIRKTYGEYDEIRQYESYRKGFSIKNHKKFLLKYSDKNIGWLNYAENDSNIDLIQLLILPEYQSRGIGSQIIKHLITIANEKNKEIILDVFKCNYRAKNLYLKLGFNIYDENETVYFLKFKKMITS